MKVRGKGTVLIGLEGRSPPLPFIEIEDGEGEALIALGLAVEVSDEEAELAQVEEAPADDQVEEPAQPSIPVTDTAAQAKVDADIAADHAAEASEEASEEGSEAPAEESTDDNVGAGEPDQGGQEGETRAELIAEALDLVEADGLVKNGDRAGKPKVSAIEAITGLTDVTADEIDAAVAAREAA